MLWRYNFSEVGSQSDVDEPPALAKSSLKAFRSNLSGNDNFSRFFTVVTAIGGLLLAENDLVSVLVVLRRS